MNPQHWFDVERLFHEALALPPQRRLQFLDDSCAGNDALKHDVQSLLDESDGDDFLETPALDPGATRLQQLTHSSLVGRRLSEYEITARIGAGGMGEVYRARDVKLGRDVAVKVLPSRMAHDTARIARFKREAQILATLNHPHIAAIYALEESEDVVALVLELVDGATLDDRIRQRQLALNDALTIARQTAEALEAAHAKGIVHRDLKPANIKAPYDGTVKVLDFGLAKAIDEETAGYRAPLTMSHATQEGMIVGTITYMSPEQARGLPVDKRTDIWAFGCVMYEMITRRKAFEGDTVADCLAAILEQNPDWTALSPLAPPNVVALIKRCLEKDVQRRLPDISEARRQLEDALAIVTARISPRPDGGPAKRRVPRLTYVASIVGLIVAGAFGVRAVRQLMLKPERVEIGLANDEFIPSTHSSELALSSDGTLIAYGSSKRMASMPTMNPGSDSAVDSGHSDDPIATPMSSMAMAEQIYARPIGQGAARPLGGALGSGPFFSPDGKWLGFWHAPTGTLRKIAVSGGAPVKICDAVSGIAGATWGPDGTIVFAWFDLFRVPASGGSPTTLLKVDEARGERFLRHPSFLPSGKAILFTVGMADSYSYDDADIGVLSLDTGKKRILIRGGTSPRYAPSGHLVYARAGTLLAVPFDSAKLEVTGQPFPVANDVFMSANTGMAAFSISETGRLVYAAGPEERGTRVPVWVDKNGRKSPLPVKPQSYLHPRISPDGHQLAIEVEGASHDIFTYDFARGGEPTKMSFDGASHWPSWTPDGRRLTFRSWKTGTMTMWWMPADRSGDPELLTNIGSMQSPESWSPDGKTLAFTQMNDPQSGSDIYTLSLDGGKRPHALLQTKFSEGSPKFSPNGAWLAYSTNESGQPEVWAMAYPTGERTRISTNGGTDPLWRHDGRQLYYRLGDQMMVVDISYGSSLEASKPKVLWRGNYLAGAGSSCGMAGPTSANYDITPDGERFIMIEDASSTAESEHLRVVSNWSVGLKNPGAINLQSSKIETVPSAR
jgi:serine/threonine protein kinase/Tol biopolymer transport system component